MKPSALMLLVAVFSLTTLFLGWWSVPLVAACWGGIADPSSRPALTAGVAAALSWALFLGWSGLLGPMGLLVSKLGAIAGVPGATFVVLTLFLPFVLAVSAAALPELLQRPVR